MMNLIKKIFYKFGHDVKKTNQELINNLLKNKITENPVILDVGGNKGQSIKIFKQIFKNPIIHSFEPIKSEFDIMYQEFKDDVNVYLNNYALGEVSGEKKFNITTQTGASSFNQINNNTEWLKERAIEYSKHIDDFTTSEKVKIFTLDEYCLNNKINHVDLLKIDTQGYENKVLQGGINNLKQNKVKAVLTEIIFDNVYDKYFAFSEIEKFLIPNNFRMVGIQLGNNNLFSSLNFFADVYYFNKNFYKL